MSTEIPTNPPTAGLATELTGDPATAQAVARSIDVAHLGHGQMFAISAMAFALSVLWGALLTLVVPIQIEDLLRRAGLSEQSVVEQKSGMLGLVVAAGAVVALIVPPFVGALSDKTTHRLGRRRPYIIGGILLTIAGLLAMMVPTNLAIYSAAYLLVQGGANVAGAAFTGFIPDLVPDSQRGHASGWLGMMTILGNITGLLIGSFGLARADATALLTTEQQIGTYVMVIVVLLIFLGITYAGVRETPLPGPVKREGLIAILKSLWISPREHPDFAWVWITRFLVTMGFNTVQFYLLYFLQDVVNVERDDLSQYGAVMYLGLLLSAAVAAIVGGRISDQRGRKPLVYLAGALMSVVGALFIAYIALNVLPTPGPFVGAFNTVLYLAIGFGIGYGTYQAVDWALGTDVLPNKDTDAAKDLGVWHIAFVLPQSLATALAGWLLTLAATGGMAAGPRYSLVFAMSIVYFILGTLLIRNVRGAR